MNGFECVIPILNVKNFAVSMDYYVNNWVFARSGTEAIQPHSGVSTRGQAEIFSAKERKVSLVCGVSIFLDDVDALHEEYKSRGAVIRQPPDMPCGALGN